MTPERADPGFIQAARRAGGAISGLKQTAAMLKLRRCTMRENLLPAEKFPDIELVNENDELTKISSLMRGFPMAVVFSRG
jgi:hypothetical protein